MTCTTCKHCTWKPTWLGLRKLTIWCRLYKKRTTVRCIDFKERP